MMTRFHLIGDSPSARNTDGSTDESSLFLQNAPIKIKLLSNFQQEGDNCPFFTDFFHILILLRRQIFTIPHARLIYLDVGVRQWQWFYNKRVWLVISLPKTKFKRLIKMLLLYIAMLNKKRRNKKVKNCLNCATEKKRNFFGIKMDTICSR